jgi:hypothetical protein
MDVLGFHFVINDNSRLNATWSEFETPIYRYTTIDSDGYGSDPIYISRHPRLLIAARQRNLADLFLRRIERGRITSTAHGRFWTNEISGALPRVRYSS